MDNRIQVALQEATPEEVEEFLGPFRKFGVRTMEELRKEFLRRHEYMTRKLKEEEEKAKEARLVEERQNAYTDLTEAGIKVSSPDSPTVKAYLSLEEGERPEFVKTLLPTPISSSRPAQEAPKKETENTETEEEKPALSESEVSGLVEMFPEKVGT